MCLVVSRPSHLRFIPHVFVRFLLRGAFSQNLGGPKAPKPEPQIGGKASFSGMYPWGITDMCCCQLAAAVAHLLPVLNSSCLCFVAPKQGPDSGSKNGATILKLVAQLPNLWPQFGPMVYAFCLLQRVRCAATGCICHSCFLALGARMLFFSQYIYIYTLIDCVYVYLSIIYIYIYTHVPLI